MICLVFPKSSVSSFCVRDKSESDSFVCKLQRDFKTANFKPSESRIIWACRYSILSMNRIYWWASFHSSFSFLVFVTYAAANRCFFACYLKIDNIHKRLRCTAKVCFLFAPLDRLVISHRAVPYANSWCRSQNKCFKTYLFTIIKLLALFVANTAT